MNADATRRQILEAMREATRKDMANDYRDEFVEVMTLSGTSMEEAAKLLGVSYHTIRSWSKPPTSKSHNRCPKWAVELLKLETE